MTANVEKANMEKVLEAVAKSVSKKAKKFNQPVIVIENGQVKKIYPYKKQK